MATSLQEVSRMLDSVGIRYERHAGPGDAIVFGFETKHYRDRNGRKGLLMVIKLEEDGEYFKLFAPMAYQVSRENAHPTLLMTAAAQWFTKLIQFEYDPSDGEIRPIIEFPIEDGTLTTRQLLRCIHGMVQLVDDMDDVIRPAVERGEANIDALRRKVSGGAAIFDMLRQLVELIGGRGESDDEPRSGPDAF